MAIFLNGSTTNPTRVVFNGNDNVDRVIFRHNNADTVVWQKKITVTPSAESYYDGYWRLNYPYDGYFYSDTTDFKLNFGSSVVNNPLTLVDMEVNYGTYTTDIADFSLDYSWIDEDSEGDTYVKHESVTYKGSGVTPTISVINNGTGKLAYAGDGVLYAIRNNLYNTDYIKALDVFPSVINSATYVTNLSDYLARWTVFCREEEHTDAGKPTLSEKPQYSNTVAVYNPTVGCPLYIALPDEPPFADFPTGTSWDWSVKWDREEKATLYPPTINSVRFKFIDSNGKTWYTSWITSGIGYGFPAFEIYPV